MRRGIEMLAWLVSQESGDATVGELAARFSETPDRIIDAIDVMKRHRGPQIPPVPRDEADQ